MWERVATVGSRILPCKYAVYFDLPDRNLKIGGQECPPHTFIGHSFLAQQMPRLFIASVLGERVVRRQTNDILYSAGDFNRDDVPAIGWNHIDREKIYLGGGVGFSRTALNCAGIQLASAVTGGLYLHAEKAASGFDDEVVAAAVSPRLDYAQARVRRRAS